MDWFDMKDDNVGTSAFEGLPVTSDRLISVVLNVMF
jgi:hypothetical protein